MTFFFSFFLSCCTFILLRQALQLAHDRLRQLILEMLRITIATEDEISRSLGICVEGDCAGGNNLNKGPSGNRDTQSTGLALIFYLLYARTFTS